jgi:hypothetical protein
MRALTPVAFAAFLMYAVRNDASAWQLALIGGVMASVLAAAQEVTRKWRLYADVHLDHKRLVITRDHSRAWFTRSINRADLLDVARRDDRSVDITFLDRGLLGKPRRKTLSLRMRDTTEADGLVFALGDESPPHR